MMNIFNIWNGDCTNIKLFFSIYPFLHISYYHIHINKNSYMLKVNKKKYNILKFNVIIIYI